MTFAGKAVTWNGHRWSAPHKISELPSFVYVDCPAAHECYVGGDGVAALHGSVWSRPYELGQGWVAGISCPTTGFCAAIVQQSSEDSGTFAWVPEFRGAAITAGPVVQRDTELVAVSCPTARRCITIDGGGSVRVGTRG
jgi:hypothetical protein